ncbi:hypothetical protein [Burkholderia gladioli]|uniref:hypothetical protein n=1 Tax=Burkholderia gladioli TaxID=28095 RepID=UPI001ABAE967|nr:hypothetical protein [Burkholderia gladioli]
MSTGNRSFPPLYIFYIFIHLVQFINSFATAVPAKWEGELGPRVEPGQGEADAANQPALAQAAAAPVEAQPR